MADIKEDQEIFAGDIVSFINKDGKTVRGAVEVSGLDSESDILESMENAELPKEMLKIFTYPKHELVDKEMNEVTLLDRSLLAGDTVRRGKTGEIGTVISLDIKTDLRVLDTNMGFKNICAKRFEPFVRLSEGDKVAHNGWIGQIRDLEEDKIGIMTSHGLLDLEDDRGQINPDFRLLSSRGVYEPISDWRRNEEDSSVYLGQQLYGNYTKKGDESFAKVTDVGNGDAEVNWVAFGNHEFTPMPKNEWYSSELWQLQAPWLEEDIANTEGQGITLGARYKIKITDDEAKSLNYLRNNPEAEKLNAFGDVSAWQSLTPLLRYKEAEITFQDVIDLLVRITDTNEDDNSPWIKIDFGKYSVITYEGESICKYDSKRGERVAEKINGLFDPIFYGKQDKAKMQHEIKERIERLFAELGKILGNQFEPDKLKIHMSAFTMESAGDGSGKWRQYRTIIKEDPNLTASVRGQGHSKFEHKNDSAVSVEVVDYRVKCKVQWQSGEIDEYKSTELFPALHINDHDFCPNDFVVRENREDLDEWGNVISVDFAEKQLVVQWHSDKTLKERETLSVFDIADHPDYKFRMGELVVGTNATELPGSGVGMVKSILPSGHLEILWADRTESLVLPVNLISEHVLFGDAYEEEEEINEEDYDEFTVNKLVISGDEEEIADSDGSWESESEEDVVMEDKKKVDLDEELKGFVNVSAGAKNTVKSEPELTAVIENTLEAAHSKIQEIADKWESKMSDEEKDTQEQFHEKFLEELDQENTRLEEKANEMIAEITEPPSNDVPLDELGAVHYFELPSPTHAFYKTKTEQPKSFLKIYNSEIKRLQTSLPKGIHIWTYESRLDLFSFAIEGPAGTPYEYCLFFFDICLPDGYPLTSPPKVHFKSAIKQKINPNLYDTGNVCLSLLGTWAAKRDSEDWTYNSNLLQLLVSLQGLTLNSEPYYNEAGYDRQKDTASGMENAKSYNEFITVKLCDHVISTIRFLSVKISDITF
ncbi:unnamed protein product [Oikopleura dioica]|uniref:UBC core domain-containing protein n=1 Tax=Oikopleura dioica TaxID=34765 RepID=E4Y4E4_OIKDI|nr:unnamed protein product [Oikopleura dioica]